MLDFIESAFRADKDVSVATSKRPPQFDAWIDMYAGKEFDEKVNDYVALVDAECRNASEDEFAEMQEHFNMGCKLEHMFWDQALSLMEWPTVGGM